MLGAKYSNNIFKRTHSRKAQCRIVQSSSAICIAGRDIQILSYAKLQKKKKIERQRRESRETIVMRGEREN